MIDVILVLNLLLWESRWAVDRFSEATLQEIIFTPAQNLFISCGVLSFSIINPYTCFRYKRADFFINKVTCMAEISKGDIVPNS